MVAVVVDRQRHLIPHEIQIPLDRLVGNFKLRRDRGAIRILALPEHVVNLQHSRDRRTGLPQMIFATSGLRLVVNSEIQFLHTGCIEGFLRVRLH